MGSKTKPKEINGRVLSSGARCFLGALALSGAIVAFYFNNAEAGAALLLALVTLYRREVMAPATEALALLKK